MKNVSAKQSIRENLFLQLLPTLNGARVTINCFGIGFPRYARKGIGVAHSSGDKAIDETCIRRKKIGKVLDVVARVEWIVDGEGKMDKID